MRPLRPAGADSHVSGHDKKGRAVGRTNPKHKTTFAMVSLSKQHSSFSKQQQHRPNNRTRSGHHSFTLLVITHALACVVGFYGGLLVEIGVEDRIQEQVDRRLHSLQSIGMQETHANGNSYPTSLRDVFVGMAAIDRESLTTTLDPGVPWDPSTKHNRQALVLFQTESSLPPAHIETVTSSTTEIPTLPIQEALQECHAAHVILTQPNNRKQCIVIANQYEAFHIQKFMRLPEGGGAASSNAPLVLANRAASMKGRKSTKLPTQLETETYWQSQLLTYLQRFDHVLEKLKPLAQKVVHPASHTVIVMVCNYGHIDLLLNFLCGARARGIISASRHVLVWATDEETKQVLEQYDVTVFYDQEAAQEMPKQAAGRYADKTFGKMMLAKVWCVQQLVWLGYNVLFQDADVMWYKDPLQEYLVEKASAQNDFDIYFQDDGNHSPFYAPYSANTGFYFVRANDATRNLFNTLLVSGDLIVASSSHQIPLVALLAEHASLFGLRVKIWNRLSNDFPGGHAFHRRKSFMKDIINGKEVPFIFHMSWTTNKKNKLRFFEQMGEWHLGNHNNDQCTKAVGSTNAESCCLAEPYFACHFRDKPSKHPCKRSPPIDEGRPSFW